MPEPSSPPGNDQPEATAGERQPAFSLTPSPNQAAGSAALDDPGGDLPPPSGGNRFACVARDPRNIFAYWELALPIRRIPGARLAIAVHRADGTHETTCPLENPGGTRILTVAGPDTPYQLTLGYLPVGAIHRDEMVLILADRQVRTPRDRAAGDEEKSRGESLLESTGEKSAEIRALLFPEGAGDSTSR